MKDFSYITHSHPAYIENLYQDFVQNPESVDPEYRRFFEGVDFAITNGNGGNGNGGNGNGNGHAATDAAPIEAAPVNSTQLTKEFAVYSLIQAFRNKGHLVAKTNPIRERINRKANLELKYFGLSEADLQQTLPPALLSDWVPPRCRRSSSVCK